MKYCGPPPLTMKGPEMKSYIDFIIYWYIFKLILLLPSLVTLRLPVMVFCFSKRHAKATRNEDRDIVGSRE